MPNQNSTPLRKYLRYYAANLDGVSKPLDKESVKRAQLSALGSLSKDTLVSLIEDGVQALAEATDSQIKDILNDGHTYFSWKTENAARQYLTAVISLAKQVARTS